MKIGEVVKKNLLFLSIGITVMLSGCQPPMVDVEGIVSMPLAATRSERAGDPCFAISDAYKLPDIDAGTQVKLLNAAGDMVGLGSLSEGILESGWTEEGVSRRPEDFGDALKEDNCIFKFTIADVVLEDDFYSIEISNRGAVSYTREDLQSGIYLSLND